MNLGEVLDRACDTLGELRATPRWFPRQKLVDYANRGTLLFRSLCHDVWYRVDMPVVAVQGEYTKPPEIIELRRVAFYDTTLEARAVNTLQSRDSLWQTTTGPLPKVWTSLGFAHDKFWIWPKPTVGTADSFTWTVAPDGGVDGEHGVTVRMQDSSLANYTFIRDPAGSPSWNPDYGLLVSLDGLTTDADFGEIFGVETAASLNLTLWGTAYPTTLVSDDQEVPIRRPWQQSVVWFVLWQVYEEEGDHHNSVLAAFYRDQFMGLVDRCKLRASSPVPAQVRNLRGNLNEVSTPNDEIALGDFIDSTGSAVPILWPQED